MLFQRKIVDKAGEGISLRIPRHPYQQEHSHLQMHTKFLVRGIPYVPAALVREGSTQGLHFKKLIRQKLR